MITTTAPLNGQATTLATIVERLEFAHVAADWRAEIASAIAQLQKLLTGDGAAIWNVIATRPAGLEGDPAGDVVVPCNTQPLTYPNALARCGQVLAGNTHNRLPYTVRIELAH